MRLAFAYAWARPARRRKPCYVNHPEAFVNDACPHSALRQLRRQFRHPATLSILAAVIFLLTLMGPFGTDRSLGAAMRCLYWTALVLGTFCAGSIASAIAGRLADRLAQRILVAGLLTGSAAIVVVFTLNAVVFGYVPTAGSALRTGARVLAIGFVVTAVIQVVFHELDRSRPPAPDQQAPPPILERLPLDKRGSLLALSVEDHYVRVRTSRGAEMLLMRLSDAMRETGGVQGAQVHRSHWVAWGAVEAARREGDRAILTLKDGSAVPVSRANLAVIREAGLLPR